ncbi:MAG: glycosyltransferase N-terminal domain-containing protein [Marinilabilia sp.]
MRLLYILSIHLYGLLLSLMAPFHEKARLMKKGRKNVWRRISDRPLRGSAVVWIHCASLGEFEQGRPVIEAIKEKHPGKKIVLTFFSPSGYEIRKNYPLADLVTYLPADTPGNAERFIDALKPEVAIFVKYEFWPFFLNTLKKRGIPLYSISAIFRKEQIFFRWYGRWFRNALKAVTKFYVQDKASGEYLASIGLNNYAVTGDTRFDRVKAIVASAKEVPEAAEFAAHASLVLVAGSTWPPDEDILARYINQTPDGVRMIIAPHEVHEARIARLEEQLEVPCFRYSRCEGGIPEGKKVMIVDTIGLLSAIYRYGHIAYIGGGFGKGIHNTLEAATYGIPVIFGPRYQKFREARELLATGGAFTVKDYRDFFPVAENLRTDDEFRRQMGEAAARYVDSMCGATRVILEEVLAHSAKS